MTTTGELLSPLPYEDVPTGKVPRDNGPAERALDDAPAPTRELAPDVPPSRDIEGMPPLMGSPILRPVFPSPGGGRGLDADTSRPTALPSDEGHARDLPDVLIPALPARAEPKAPSIDDETGRLVGEAVTRAELTALKKTITELYERVSSELAPNPAKAAIALSWLSEARTIGLGRPGQFPLAELRVAQTRTLLEQYRQSHAAGTRNARALVVANVFWLLLFGVLFFLDQWVQGGGAGANFRAISSLFPPWLSVLAGGMGGALAALVALGRVVSQREYNPDNDLDYHLNSFKGAVLGGVAFYLILGGFVTAAATSGVELANGVGAGSLMERVQAGAAESPLYIIIAFIAGLAQQRLLALLGRIWSQRTGESEPATVNAELAAIPAPVADVPVATPGDDLPPPVAAPLPPEGDGPLPAVGGLG